MKYLVASAVCLLSLLKWTDQTNVKIAIIGGGIGGTSCAYFLRELFNDTVDIDLYEGNQVGGRLATVTMNDGYQYESGGAVLHERNKYMSRFTNTFGLHNRTKVFQNVRLGLYNGKDFDFIGNDYYLVNLMKIVWRYGFSAKRLRAYIKDFLDKFNRLYEAQANGVTFNTTFDMLLTMDPEIKDYMDISVRDSYLKYEEFPESLINELVEASCRVNYGQTINNVHEFVGSISMSGIEGSLWAVKGGNKRVPEVLLNVSNAHLKAEFVSKIINGHDSCVVTTASGANNTYDYVVLAAPYTRNQPTSIQMVDMPAEVRKFGKYHRTVSTLIIGRLRPTRFPDIVVNDSPISIVSNNERDYFYAVTNVEEVNETASTNAWKVLSAKPLTKPQIDELFEYTSDVKTVEWVAYPQYQIPTPPQPFLLADRVYHVNAIEWAASAMEMSCIGAKNVALLVHKHHATTVLEKMTTNGGTQP